jgi:hypothetical protein
MHDSISSVGPGVGSGVGSGVGFGVGFGAGQVPHATGQATLARTPSSDLTLALQRFDLFLPTQAQFFFLSPF